MSLSDGADAAPGQSDDAVCARRGQRAVVGAPDVLPASGAERRSELRAAENVSSKQDTYHNGKKANTNLTIMSY